jgi:hypothetical protein
MKNKILSMLLVASIIVGLICPIVSFAEGETTVNPVGIVDSENMQPVTAEWQLFHTGNTSYYYVVNKHSGLYLTRSVDNGNPSNVYEQASLGGSGLQYWNVFVNTDGYMYLWDWFSQALTINTDNTITCTAMDWSLNTSRSKYFAYNPTIADGIETKLTIEGGISIQTGTATPSIQALSTTVTPQMRWQFIKDGTYTNYYRIKNVATGMFLTRKNDSSNGILDDKIGAVTEMDMINSYQQLWNIWTMYGVYNIWGVTAAYADAVDTGSLGNQALTVSSGVVSWTNSAWVGGSYGFATDKVFHPFGQIISSGAFGNGLVTKLMPLTSEGCIKTSRSVTFSSTSAFSKINASAPRITTTGENANFGYITNLSGLEYGIGYVTWGDTISIPNVDFGTVLGATTATIEATSAYAGHKFELYLDNDYNNKIGEFAMAANGVDNLDGRYIQTVTIDITKITGVHTVNIKWAAVGSFFSIKFTERAVDFGSYVISNSNITKINPNANLTVSSLLSQITISGSASYAFKNGETTLAPGDKAGTGTNLILNGLTTYSILIYGDVTGDGDISISDLSAIKGSILNISPLTGIKKDAGDISKNGSVSISELLTVKKHILGISSIIQ